jgi:hypothetical protein
MTQQRPVFRGRGSVEPTHGGEGLFRLPLPQGDVWN